MCTTYMYHLDFFWNCLNIPSREVVGTPYTHIIWSKIFSEHVIIFFSFSQILQKKQRDDAFHVKLPWNSYIAKLRNEETMRSSEKRGTSKQNSCSIRPLVAVHSTPARRERSPHLWWIAPGGPSREEAFGRRRDKDQHNPHVRLLQLGPPSNRVPSFNPRPVSPRAATAALRR
jgi:hypothetical protein